MKSSFLIREGATNSVREGDTLKIGGHDNNGIILSKLFDLKTLDLEFGQKLK